MTLTVYRAGAEVEVTLTLDERPEETEVQAVEDAANQPAQQQNG